MSELSAQLWTKRTGFPLPQSLWNKLAPSRVTMNGVGVVFAVEASVFWPPAETAAPLVVNNPAPVAANATDFRTFRLCIISSFDRKTAVTHPLVSAQNQESR